MMDASHPNPRIAQRLENIYRLHRKAIDLRLERSPYTELLDRLGRPQDKLPPVVHIAGTNGKGSTLAFLRAMLEADGYTAHVYTSPHLLRFNERVVIAGREIPDDDLLDALDRIDAINDGLPLTFFEYTTALALDVFARHKADICLLETGMGGRLDCTNVLAQPACTAITNIGLDHVQFLGDTIEKIAAEKAGIMKFGVDCVIGPQDHTDAVMPVFRDIARKNAVMLHRAQPVGADVTLGLYGAHQRANAGTALAILDVLKTKRFCFDDAAVTQGLANATWPGRLAQVTDEKRTKLAVQLMADMPDGAQLWYDGGHNPAGAKILGDCLTSWRADGHPVLVAFGMQSDKDAAAFLQHIAPHAAGIVLLDVPGGMHPQSAVALYDRLPTDLRARCVIGAQNAREFAPRLAGGTPHILVCGSLYLYQQIHNAH